MFQTPATIRKRYDVSSSTLRRWAKDGKIRCLHTAHQRLYDAEQLRTMLGDTAVDDGSAAECSEQEARETVLYARVSSSKQKEDLDRQIADLRTAYPDAARLFSDIGSGLNFHRPGFTALLERVMRGTVGRVVVAHRDRLCRLAGELVEWLLAQFDTELVVSGQDDKGDECSELADDLLAVTTFFVARANGRRAADNRRRRQRKHQAQEEEGSVRQEVGQARSGTSGDHQDVSDGGGEAEAPTVDGLSPFYVQPGIGCHQ